MATTTPPFPLPLFEKLHIERTTPSTAHTKAQSPAGGSSHCHNTPRFDLQRRDFRQLVPSPRGTQPQPRPLFMVETFSRESERGREEKLSWFADQWARALPPPLKGPSAGRGVRVRDQPAEKGDRVWNSLRRCHSNATTTTKRSKGGKTGTSNNTLSSASRNKEGKTSVPSHQKTQAR